ncbi:MAG: patatin-like phospholipase family protein [Flavobacteriales bacterium]|nr:patatin-like phospholipase family protein [Flavobacteriales bacterium]
MKFLFAIALISVSFLGFSQQEKTSSDEFVIKNLVFEGAGMRGIAYAGVIRSLEEHGMVGTIEKTGGTSAGAISALLFALGYSSGEMDTIISNTKFQKFNDGKYFFVGGISRTVNKFGWYQGEEFTDWIGALIKEKTDDSEITFEQLHQRGFVDLYVTASCLNQQKLVVLSRETYPEMKVKDAVRISMSIPLYFQAVFVDSAGNTYFKQDEDNPLDIMVDGGITGNFPIYIFDVVRTDSMNRIVRIPDFQTLGVRIDTDEQIENDKTVKELAPYTITDFSDYISAFYVMVIENLNRNQLTEDDWKRTISVSSVGISPKVKRLSAQQKQMLVKSGYDHTENYLSNRVKH